MNKTSASVPGIKIKKDINMFWAFMKVVYTRYKNFFSNWTEDGYLSYALILGAVVVSKYMVLHGYVNGKISASLTNIYELFCFGFSVPAFILCFHFVEDYFVELYREVKKEHGSN